MTKPLLSKKEMGIVAPMLLIVGLLVVGGGAVFVFHRAGQREAAIQHKGNERSVTPRPIQHGFEARSFYDQVDNGMDLNQLNQLAGKNGDCTITDVYPAPKTIPCYWSDSSHVVQVTLTNGEAVSKSLQENQVNETN